MSLYLNEEYELVNERPAKKLSDVQVEKNSYEGNTQTEYIFRVPLHINKWKLCSITINKNWYVATLHKIMVHRDQMNLINLKDSLGISKFIAEDKWEKKKNTELGLDSMILRKVISFLETIPTELKSKKGVELYFTGLGCINMNGLSQFYKEILNSRQILSESDIIFLEDFYVNKMSSLLAN